MSMELRVLNATIDLAASQRTGESIEWLPFCAVLDAFRSICFQLSVSGDLERRCYRLLLLMDADSDSINTEGFSPTWWEKVHQLPKYMAKLDNHKPQVQFSKSNKSIAYSSSSSNKARRSSNESALSLSSPPYASMPLMSSQLHPSTRSPVRPVVLRYEQPDDGRQFQQPPSSNSLMSPSLLNEGVELSLLLNHQVPQRYTPTKLSNLSTMPSSSSHMAKSLDSKTIRTSRFSNTDAVERSQMNSALDDLSEKISSVEKESRTTRNLIAQLAYRKAHSLSPSRSRANSTGTGDQPLTHSTTKRHIHFDETVDSDGIVDSTPAQNDISTIIGASHRFDPNNAIESPALSRASTPIGVKTTISSSEEQIGGEALQFQALLSPGDQVQEFSRALHTSTVMQKYLSRSAASGVDAVSIPTTIDLPTVSVTANENSRAKNRRLRIDDLELSAPNVDIFEHSQSKTISQSSLQQPSTRGQLSGTTKTKMGYLRESSPSNISHIINNLQEQFEQQSSISISGNDQMALSEPEQLIAQLSHDMMSTPSLVAFFNSGTENMDHMLVTPEATAAAVSAMKLLIMFQKWILRYSAAASSLSTNASTLSPASMLLDKLELKFPEYHAFVRNEDSIDDNMEHRHRAYRSPYDVPERIIPIMFYHHISLMPDFVSLSNLFGLEQWLREKMRNFLILQSKRMLFQRWSNFVGVNHQSKVHYCRYQKRKGLNYFIENVIRIRLRRKNAMMVFAYRRDQSLPDSKVLHSMGSLFRNLKRSKRDSTEVDPEDLNYSFGLFSSHSEKQLQLPHRNSVGGEFSTVSSIRQFVHATQYALEVLHQPDAMQLQSPSGRSQAANPKASKLAAQGRMFVGQEASVSVGRVRKQAYEVAQDLIALFFMFRRLYRRTVYHRRFQFVCRRYQLHRCLVSSFRAWRKAFHQRLAYHEHMAPQISLTYDKVLKYRVQRAFRILQSNVQRQQHIRDHLAAFHSRIVCKDVFVKALHLFKHPILVRMFLQWKENYMNHNVPVVLLRQAEQGYLHRARRRSVRRLMHWARARQLKRGQRFQQHPGLSRLYEQVRDASRFPGAKSASSRAQMQVQDASHMLTREVSNRVWKAYQQQRYLTRWWCFAKRTKVFSSLLDLKFHHTYTRATATSSSASGTAQYEQTNLRRRFHTLTRQICTSIPLSAPRRRFLWKMKRAQQQFQRLAASGDNSTIAEGIAKHSHQVDEKHYQLIFFEHPNEMKIVKSTSPSKNMQSSVKTKLKAVSNRDLAALRMRLIDFPTSSFASMPILQDDSFVYLVDNGESLVAAPSVEAEKNAAHRPLHHRMAESTQPKSSYLAERDEDDDEDYVYPNSSTDSARKATVSSLQYSGTTRTSGSRYVAADIDSGALKTPQGNLNVKRSSSAGKSRVRMPKVTTMLLLQRAGERLEHLHQIAFASNSAAAATSFQSNPAGGDAKPGLFLAQCDTNQLWQQQQHLRRTFNTTMALKRALHCWITNHRQQQQIYKQYDHLHSIILRSQTRKVWSTWYTIWKYISFWRKQRRCHYMKRLERATVNRLVHKRAQSTVNRYLVRRALRVLLLYSHQRRYLREYETVRFYNHILDQLTTIYSSSATYPSGDVNLSLSRPPTVSCKKRRQQFWHFLTHSEALVPYPLRHFLVHHPSFRFPFPPPPTEDLSEYVKQHNRYTSKYPFPVYPAQMSHINSQQAQGSNNLTINQHSNASSFFYNDHVHTSIQKTTAAMRRMSQSASASIQAELSTLSLTYQLHKNGNEHHSNSQIPLIIHYLAQVIPLFHLLTRAFNHWNSFTLHYDKLHRIHRHCYMKGVTFAFHKLKRHHHECQLQHHVHRIRLRTFLLAWRGVLLQKHTHQQRYLKHALHHWRYHYQRAVVVRVWEKAWGYRIRSAMQKWRMFAQDLSSRVYAVTEYLRYRRLLESMCTWYLHLRSQTYYHYRQKQKFFKRIRMWLAKRRHFVYDIEHRRARWHHVRQITVGRWLKNSQSQAKQRRWMLLAQWWRKFSGKQEGYLTLRQNCQQKLQQSLKLGHSLEFVNGVLFHESYEELQERLVRYRLHLARHWQTRQWPLMRYQYKLTERFEENYRQFGSAILYPYNPTYHEDTARSHERTHLRLDIEGTESSNYFHFPVSPATQYRQDFPQPQNANLYQDSFKNEQAHQQKRRPRGNLLQRFESFQVRNEVNNSNYNQYDNNELYHDENIARIHLNEDIIAEEEAYDYDYHFTDNRSHEEMMETKTNISEISKTSGRPRDLNHENHSPSLISGRPRDLNRENHSASWNWGNLSHHNSFFSTKSVQGNNPLTIDTRNGSGHPTSATSTASFSTKGLTPFPSSRAMQIVTSKLSASSLKVDTGVSPLSSVGAQSNQPNAASSRFNAATSTTNLNAPLSHRSVSFAASVIHSPSNFSQNDSDYEDAVVVDTDLMDVNSDIGNIVPNRSAPSSVRSNSNKGMNRSYGNFGSFSSRVLQINNENMADGKFFARQNTPGSQRSGRTVNFEESPSDQTQANRGRNVSSTDSHFTPNNGNSFRKRSFLNNSIISDSRNHNGNRNIDTSGYVNTPIGRNLNSNKRHFDDSVLPHGNTSYGNENAFITPSIRTVNTPIRFFDDSVIPNNSSRNQHVDDTNAPISRNLTSTPRYFDDSVIPDRINDSNRTVDFTRYVNTPMGQNIQGSRKYFQDYNARNNLRNSTVDASGYVNTPLYRNEIREKRNFDFGVASGVNVGDKGTSVDGGNISSNRIVDGTESSQFENDHERKNVYLRIDNFDYDQPVNSPHKSNSKWSTPHHLPSIRHTEANSVRSSSNAFRRSNSSTPFRKSSDYDNRTGFNVETTTNEDVLNNTDDPMHNQDTDESHNHPIRSADSRRSGNNIDSADEIDYGDTRSNRLSGTNTPGNITDNPRSSGNAPMRSTDSRRSSNSIYFGDETDYVDTPNNRLSRANTTPGNIGNILMRSADSRRSDNNNDFGDETDYVDTRSNRLSRANTPDNIAGNPRINVNIGNSPMRSADSRRSGNSIYFADEVEYGDTLSNRLSGANTPGNIGNILMRSADSHHSGHSIYFADETDYGDTPNNRMSRANTPGNPRNISNSPMRSADSRRSGNSIYFADEADYGDTPSDRLSRANTPGNIGNIPMRSTDSRRSDNSIYFADEAEYVDTPNNRMSRANTPGNIGNTPMRSADSRHSGHSIYFADEVEYGDTPSNRLSGANTPGNPRNISNSPMKSADSRHSGHSIYFADEADYGDTPNNRLSRANTPRNIGNIPLRSTDSRRSDNSIYFADEARYGDTPSNRLSRANTPGNIAGNPRNISNSPMRSADSHRSGKSIYFADEAEYVDTPNNRLSGASTPIGISTRRGNGPSGDSYTPRGQSEDSYEQTIGNTTPHNRRPDYDNTVVGGNGMVDLSSLPSKSMNAPLTPARSALLTGASTSSTPHQYRHVTPISTPMLKSYQHSNFDSSPSTLAASQQSGGSRGRLSLAVVEECITFALSPGPAIPPLPTPNTRTIPLTPITGRRTPNAPQSHASPQHFFPVDLPSARLYNTNQQQQERQQRVRAQTFSASPSSSLVKSNKNEGVASKQNLYIRTDGPSPASELSDPMSQTSPKRSSSGLPSLQIATSMFSPLSSPSHSHPHSLSGSNSPNRMRPSELAVSPSPKHSTPQHSGSNTPRGADPLAKWRVKPATPSSAKSPTATRQKSPLSRSYPHSPMGRPHIQTAHFSTASPRHNNGPSHPSQSPGMFSPKPPLSAASSHTSPHKSPGIAYHSSSIDGTGRAPSSSSRASSPLFRTAPSPRETMLRSPVGSVSAGVSGSFSPHPTTTTPLPHRHTPRHIDTGVQFSSASSGSSSVMSPPLTHGSQATHATHTSRYTFLQDEDERLCLRQLQYLFLRRWLRHYYRRRHHPRVAFYHHSFAACARSLRYWYQWVQQRKQKRKLQERAGQLACLRRWVVRVNDYRSQRVLLHDWAVSYAALQKMKRMLKRWRKLSVLHRLHGHQEQESEWYLSRRRLYLTWGKWKKSSVVVVPRVVKEDGVGEEKEESHATSATKRQKPKGKERGNKQNDPTFALFHRVKSLLQQHT